MHVIAMVLAAILGAPLLLLGATVAVTWEPDRPLSQLKLRWAPPPSTFVQVQGMSVHLRDEGPRGDPLPIVLLHGTSSSLHTWDGWTEALSPKRRVIRFDLPGIGLTGPAPDADYRIERYVQFVVAMLDYLGVPNCILVGNSFGGQIAWETALTQPRRVIESSLRNVYGDPDRVAPQLVQRYFELTLRPGNRRALAQRFAQAPAGIHPERIPALKTPTPILWGGRDRLLPPADADKFHRAIAGSRLIVFEQLGHVPQEEDPAATVAAAQQFIS